MDFYGSWNIYIRISLKKEVYIEMKTWNIPAVEELNVKATAHGGATQKYEANPGHLDYSQYPGLDQKDVSEGGALDLEGYRTQS